jgi:hypothetical protein
MLPLPSFFCILVAQERRVGFRVVDGSVATAAFYFHFASVPFLCFVAAQ